MVNFQTLWVLFLLLVIFIFFYVFDNNHDYNTGNNDFFYNIIYN